LSNGAGTLSEKERQVILGECNGGMQDFCPLVLPFKSFETKCVVVETNLEFEASSGIGGKIWDLSALK
jgi:hypothetical protein